MRQFKRTSGICRVKYNLKPGDDKDNGGDYYAYSY